MFQKLALICPLEEIDERQRRKAEIEILKQLSEQSLELVGIHQMTQSL